jgi:hypothetical protein
MYILWGGKRERERNVKSTLEKYLLEKIWEREWYRFKFEDFYINIYKENVWLK